MLSDLSIDVLSSFVLGHSVYDVAFEDIAFVVLDVSHSTTVIKFYHRELWLGSLLAIRQPGSSIVNSISNFDLLGHL